MLGSALISAAAAWFGYTGGYTFPLIMIGRPIFLGPLLGLLLGDFQTGCVLGAQLEVIFLGIVYVGGTTGADVCSSTVIAVSLAILYGISNDEAIALAMPLAVIGAVFRGFEPAIAEVLQVIPDRALEKDNQFMYGLLGGLCHFVMLLPGTLITFFAVFLGGDFVNMVMDSLPQFVLDGISAFGAIMPAVGMAMMINLLWSKKVAIFFLLGFFITQYAGIDVLFLTIIAVCLAVLDYFYYNPKAQVQTTSTAASSEEEDFLQ